MQIPQFSPAVVFLFFCGVVKKDWLLFLAKSLFGTKTLKIAVLGAGITGITTAYYLAKAGMEVSVFDRQHAPAEETSFANGGQISVSQPFPWSSPQLPMQLMKWLGRKDAPLVFKLQKDPFMWQWALRFLANSRSSTFYRNAGKNLRLALHSKACLEDIVQAESLTYHQEKKGILKLFTGNKEAEHAAHNRGWLLKNGIEQVILSRQECMTIEPALANTQSDFTGGTYSPDDESGDAHLFALQLEQIAKDLNVIFNYNFEIDSLRYSGDQVTSFLSQGEEYKFDKFILCSGSYSRFFAKQINVSLPIYPVKGYSVSIPVGTSNSAPLTSITDETNHVVISRLGDQLRAAGTAEINGYQLDPNPLREDLVLESVMRLFPGCGNPQKAERWCGLRPMTSDSVPVIGRARYKNFYTNTGHGALGWTMACGSAQHLASIIAGQSTELDISDYSVDRF